VIEIRNTRRIAAFKVINGVKFDELKHLSSRRTEKLKQLIRLVVVSEIREGKLSYIKFY